MGTYGKYVIAYNIFIVTAGAVERENRTVLHGSSPSWKSVLVQELVLNQKLATFVSIAVIKLFYVEAQCKRICWISIALQKNLTNLFVPKSPTRRELEGWSRPWITPEMGIVFFQMLISQFGLYQVGISVVIVYPAVFSHHSAIPKEFFLGDYGGHTFIGIMKSWSVLPQIVD